MLLTSRPEVSWCAVAPRIAFVLAGFVLTLAPQIAGAFQTHYSATCTCSHCTGAALEASAFSTFNTTANNSRWTSTSSGSTGSAGDPITLTWSFVPEGTQVATFANTSVKEPSELIAALDTKFGEGDGGDDLTQRPWFVYFEESFARLSAVSGVTYLYEPNDNGSPHPTTQGVAGVRGDVRIGGLDVDGISGTLAYNFFPSSGGDMVIDVNDFINNALLGRSQGDFLYLRNTIMHEAGHGLGLEHISSNNARILMEPSVSVSFSGPQHDDIRGLHWLYGDALEKGGRNETAAPATDLGTLVDSVTTSLGTDGSGQVVAADATDFVSISNENDTDFFAFTIDAASLLDVTMTPVGASHNQGSTVVDSTIAMDLTLAIFDTDGTSLLMESTGAAAGIAESITGLELLDPGTYYARIDSATSTFGQQAQMYQLDLLATFLLDGDYNRDGTVDVDDFVVWKEQFGMIGDGLAADGNRDGIVDSADY
ncbi:MAG: matrixin family metalloprotease, partial [Planctomycetota bacterium]